MSRGGSSPALGGPSLGAYFVHPLAAPITERLLGEGHLLPTTMRTIAVTIALRILPPRDV